METNLSLAFLDHKYKVTIKLLSDVQDYETTYIDSDFLNLTPWERNCARSEVQRIYKRLDELLVWLILQRAIAKDDMPTDFLKSSRLRLSTKQEYLTDSAKIFKETLPERLCCYLEESRRLYFRLLKIDELIHKRAQEG